MNGAKNESFRWKSQHVGYTIINPLEIAVNG